MGAEMCIRDRRNVVVKGKFLSDIYEVTFTVADENSGMEYQNDKGESISGSTFVGRDSVQRVSLDLRSLAKANTQI